MTLNFSSSCSDLSNTRITGMRHYIWLGPRALWQALYEQSNIPSLLSYFEFQGRHGMDVISNYGLLAIPRT